MRSFVVFEGIDGSGKSTISSKVFERLRENGIDAILTHEPFNENIKKCIEDFLKRDADPISIAMLFIADRIEHSKMIKEWLDQDGDRDNRYNSLCSAKRFDCKDDNASDNSFHTWLSFLHRFPLREYLD